MQKDLEDFEKERKIGKVKVLAVLLQERRCCFLVEVADWVMSNATVNTQTLIE